MTRTLLAIAAALMFVAAVTLPRWAAADEVDDAKAHAVMRELLKEMRYTGPEPELTRVNQHELVEVCRCGNSRGGVYRDSSVYLWIGLDLDSLFGQSILVHELQHHIQFVKLGHFRGCDEWHRREMEAFQKQNEWLSAHGSGTRGMFLGSCPRTD